MLPGIGEPYGGFLGFSEAWYTLVARGYEHGSLLSPRVTADRPDYNVPPLFSWLLHAGHRAWGASEASSRMVAMVGALLAIVATARIGGALAALLLATSPAFLLVGRNVQPDGWALALALWSYVLWPRGTSSRVWPSALCFGFSIATKPTTLELPAALFLLAVVEQRGLGWIGKRHVLWAAVAASPALAWTALQLKRHPEAFLGGVRHGGTALEWPTPDLLPALVTEVLFSGFPALLLALLAVVHLRSEPRLRPAAATLTLGLAVFVPVHYHGYYLVLLAPAAAVLAAHVLLRRRAVAAALVALNAVAALVMLGGHKLGRGAVATIASEARGARFLLSPEAYAGYWTLVELYGRPAAPVMGTGCADGAGATPLYLLPAPVGAAIALSGIDAVHAPAAFGWAVVEEPANPHRLTWGAIRLVRTPGVSAGFARIGASRYGGARVPAGERPCVPEVVPTTD